MKGAEDTLFDPNGDITRGQIVTMLYRLEGEPDVAGAGIFPDVESGMYYEDPIAWANGEGIVTGFDTGEFKPEDSVTREQLAVILYRYAKAKGECLAGDSMFLLDYVDSADISDWANEAARWSSMKGIINGKEGKLFDPQGRATRAEAATMMQRFCEALKK